MAAEIYIHGRDHGQEARVFAVPEWATHVVRRNLDGKLFFAFHKEGEAWYTSPNKVMEFHPDGYSPLASCPPFKELGLWEFPDSSIIEEVLQPASTILQMPEKQVGDNWWVLIPGQVALVNANITLAGVFVVGLRYTLDGHQYHKTYKQSDVEFIEPELWPHEVGA